MSVLHRFSGTDGRWPFGRLAQGRDGRLYGTTSEGGALFTSSNPRYGTVFRIDTTGALTTLHSFNGIDGANPSGGLVQAADGRFYGTTQRGGASGYGTIFAVDAKGTTTRIHSFSGSDGAYPDGHLTLARDGSIYGTTPQGGAGGGGVVFRFTPIAHVVPRRIEAEDYDGGGQGVSYADATPGNADGAYRNDDVDIKPSRDGGYAISWFTAGERLNYTLNVETAGRYRITARVGSALPGRTFGVEIDGAPLRSGIAVPQFAEWDRYGAVNVGAVRLTRGIHVLKMEVGALDYVDFDWISVDKVN
jgi:uncharacterized repeat protein (TIGR03803 family)